MINHSQDYVEYCRANAEQLRTLHDLALRGKSKERITQLIHEQIAREVQLCAEDDLVDIGCGDGTLLRMAERIGVRSATGLQATEQEAAVLRKLGLKVLQGLTDRLPLGDEFASVVVCNGVLLIVPRERIPASLSETYRIAKPGANTRNNYLFRKPLAA
ncbi:MAG TPA: class I SAM-dependent methyltransferase [Terriglobales bacterium]|nr:class I SAM-dependent methyltransferase [Terriglobales bacterium]